MTIDELQELVNATKWDFLGKGSYNTASVSATELTINGYTGKWVLKIRRDNTPNPLLTTSARAVRKWNKINPKYPALLTKNGWIAPYLGNTPASDEQIANEVIAIYRRTRILIGDAASKNNFLVYKTEVICIDMDMAFRRGSIASDNYDAARSTSFNSFLGRCLNAHYTKTVAVIKTLVYLEIHMAERDIRPKYLTTNFIEKLHNYRHDKTPLDRSVLEFLSVIEDIDYCKKIPNGFFTPEFVQLLEPHVNQKNLTETKLLTLLNDHILAKRSIVDIVLQGDLMSVLFLYKYNPLVLEQVDKEGYNLLQLAAKEGHTEIASFLIESGMPVNPANPDERVNITALDLAIVNRKTNTGLMLYNAKCAISPALLNTYESLRFFAEVGILEQVTLILSSNPNLLNAKDVMNQTVLSWAAARGHNNIVSYLISLKAEINHASIIPSNHPDVEHNGFTPLDWAAYFKRSSTAVILINAGAVSEKKLINAYYTDLFFGKIQSGDLDFVTVTLAYNISLLNKINGDGYAPIHLAADKGQSEIVSYLILKGADINLETKKPNNLEKQSLPLDYAIHGKHSSTISILMKAGAKAINYIDEYKEELSKQNLIHVSMFAPDNGNRDNEPLMDLLTKIPS